MKQFALETYCIMLSIFMIMEKFLVNAADINLMFLLNRRNPKMHQGKHLNF
jgi:hypothetical protein